jgi:hypothetical protein
MYSSRKGSLPVTILTLDAQMSGWSEALMQGAEILHVDTQDQAVA